MIAGPTAAYEPCLAFVNRLTPLLPPSSTPDCLLGLEKRIKHHPAGSELLMSDDDSACFRIVSSGWAYRATILPDGRRQIFSLILPGDIISMQARSSWLSFASVTALTNLRTVNAQPVIDYSCASPSGLDGLSDGIDALLRMEELHVLDHLVRLGSQTAVQRLAHLLLELAMRLDTIHFVHQNSFALPVSQEILGEMLGLSLVHVNRTFKELKARRLISVENRIVTVLDADGLASTAGSYPSASFVRDAPRSAAGATFAAVAAS